MSGRLRGTRGPLRSPGHTRVRLQRPWLTRSNGGAITTNYEGQYTPTQGLQATSRIDFVDRIVPRNRFGGSIFPTPLLLLLRLFYQATSFNISSLPPAVHSPRVTFRNLVTRFRDRFRVTTPRERKETISLTLLETLDISSRVAAEHWHRLIISGRYALTGAERIISMTWAKSLSAPLSHEYLQFIVECNNTGQHYRLITERDTDGDWAYIIASSPCGTPATSDSVTQHRPLDYQHDLPLPLLSASWSNISAANRPTVLDLAAILRNISQRSPTYNIMREHCWWYAEAVFENMIARTAREVNSRSSEPLLKHWPWGVYRYSYIVLGKRYLRRDVLLQQAKAFKEEMDKSGRLNW